MKKSIVFVIFLAAFVPTLLKVIAGDFDSTVMTKFQNCQTYNEQKNVNYMGFNVNYNMNILGWQNDKCVVTLDAKVVADSGEYAGQTFSPKVRCEFTKEQLDTLINNAQATNQQAMDLITEQHSCSVQNTNNMNAYTIQTND